MFQCIITYRYRYLPMVSIVGEILLNQKKKDQMKRSENFYSHDHRNRDSIHALTWMLVSHSFWRLWSKHIMDQPDVTTTRTCFCTWPRLKVRSTTPVAMATARLPEVTRILSGSRLTSARTRASLNPSSTRLEWGSKTYISLKKVSTRCHKVVIAQLLRSSAYYVI